MNSFPEHISVNNKKNFESIRDKNTLDILRNEVYLHVLTSQEDTFYDLDTFNRTYNNNMKKTHEMIEVIIQELKLLGWKTFLGFGETGLYIYSTDEKPINAY